MKMLSEFNVILFVHSQWPRVNTSVIQWEGKGALCGRGQGGRADEAAGGTEAREGTACATISTRVGQTKERAYGESIYRSLSVIETLVIYNTHAT